MTPNYARSWAPLSFVSKTLNIPYTARLEDSRARAALDVCVDAGHVVRIGSRYSYAVGCNVDVLAAALRVLLEDVL